LQRTPANPGYGIRKSGHAGVVDYLETLGSRRGYDALVERSSQLEVDEMVIRILDLEDLIAEKEQANRDKDRMVLPILRQVLRIRDEDR